MGGFKDRRREQVGEKSEYWSLYPSRALWVSYKTSRIFCEKDGGWEEGGVLEEEERRLWPNNRLPVGEGKAS